MREPVDAGGEQVQRARVAERVAHRDDPTLVGGVDDGPLDVQRRAGEIRHGEGVAQLVHELDVRRAALVDLRLDKGRCLVGGREPGPRGDEGLGLGGSVILYACVPADIGG